jgi:hypothetical protein
MPDELPPENFEIIVDGLPVRVHACMRGQAIGLDYDWGKRAPNGAQLLEAERLTLEVLRPWMAPDFTRTEQGVFLDHQVPAGQRKLKAWLEKWGGPEH